MGNYFMAFYEINQMSFEQENIVSSWRNPASTIMLKYQVGQENEFIKNFISRNFCYGLVLENITFSFDRRPRR